MNNYVFGAAFLIILALSSCNGSAQPADVPQPAPIATQAPTETLEAKLAPTQAKPTATSAAVVPTATYTPVSPTSTPVPTATPKYSEKDIEGYSLMLVYFTHKGSSVVPTEDNINTIYEKLYPNKDPDFLSFIKTYNSHLEDHMVFDTKGHPYQFKHPVPGITDLHLTDVNEDYYLVVAPSSKIFDYSDGTVGYSVRFPHFAELK